MGYFLGSLSTSCSQRGSHTLFVADFDDDVIGSLPAPTTPGHYGPPDASLNIQGAPHTVEVVDSAVLGSQALNMTRGAPDATEVQAVVGDIGDMPYTSGVVFIEFNAHGEIISKPEIAGMVISVRSSEGDTALVLRLYDGSYHLKEGDSYVRIDGSYDPGTAHFVHIELNMDTQKYTICIDDEVVADDKAFLGDFADLYSLEFLLCPTILEAFPTAYVVDDIRMTK